MERRHLFALGIGGLALAALALAQPFDKPEPLSPEAARMVSNARISARLSVVQPGSRRAIDYARLDARLRRMVEQPTMVGMAILTRLKHTPRHSASLSALSVTEGAVKAA